MIPTFTTKLELKSRLTNVIAQKIDGLTLKIYDMVSTIFWLQDNLEKIWFFKKIFLFANTSIEMILGMPFLFLSNADVKFVELRKLTWRSYDTAEALPTTSQVKLINKKKFTKVALDENSETFVVHIVALKIIEIIDMPIHPWRAAWVTTLQWDKASTEIPVEYSDYTNVFSFDQVMELPGNIGINEYVIKLIEQKQLFYESIYTFSPVKLETLKAYIKTYPRTRFIWLSRFSVGVSILFDKKSKDSLRLYINYRGLYNLIIKNRYSLPLIGKILNCLGRAKQFT